MEQGQSNRFRPHSTDRSVALVRRQAHWPDLGADINSPAWYGALLALLLLIGAAVGLAWWTVRTPNLADLAPESERAEETASLGASQEILEAPAPAEEVDTAEIPVESAEPEPLFVVRDDKVDKGDTLEAILRRSGAERSEAHDAIVALRKVQDLKKLRLGQTVSMQFSLPEAPENPGRLERVAIQTDVDRQVYAERDETSRFIAAVHQIELNAVGASAAGEIADSLYLSARRAGVPNATIIELIRIFSWDVDFQRDIRKGDRFEVFYEEMRDDAGRVLKEGDVLVASLTLRGEEKRLYRFHPQSEPFADYFDRNGKSAKKMLMRTPIDGARLTSGFGMRKHPILGYSRLHKGLDFGAPRGTPIMAAGDGFVEMAERNGGYGNYVRIRHNGQYKTAYAHMNAFGRGIRKGARVRQGQIIGYVGSTGASTGPHLHYEVLVDGKQANPKSLRLPTGYTIAGGELDAFRKTVNGIEIKVAEAKNVKFTQKLSPEIGVVGAARAATTR